MSRPSWNEYFKQIVEVTATRSPCRRLQVGCLLVKDNRIISQGYNGFPRGMLDSPNLYSNREEKYVRIVHAEMNCIYNASWNGVSLDGADLFVYGLPVCHECAKAIIQVGIKRVISPWMQNLPKKWDDSFELTNKFFKEAGVKYELVKYD